jgi:hypothetical protein
LRREKMTDRKNDIKIMMIFLITILGSLVLTSSVHAFSLNTILEKSFSVNPGETLRVEAEGGDVTIETWPQNEVYVHITGNSDAEEEVEFEVVEKDYGVYIKAEKEGSWSGFWGGIDYKIAVKVPEKFNAEVGTSGGDIKIDGMNGSAKLKTSGGDVTTENTSGNFVLKTSGGDVKAKIHSGDLDMATSGGDVTVIESTGNIDAGTSGGDIKLDAASGKIDAGTSGGDIIIHYKGENRGISLSTSGGDVSIFIDPNISADLNLKTTGGDIEVDLEATRAKKVSSTKFLGEVNNGGPEIECRTTGGDITIKGT